MGGLWLWSLLSFCPSPHITTDWWSVDHWAHEAHIALAHGPDTDITRCHHDDRLVTTQAPVPTITPGVSSPHSAPTLSLSQSLSALSPQ